MDTFAPVFSKIVDSSLWQESDLVVKVFLTLLAKKDADHVVRGSAFAIAGWAKKSEKEVLEALKVLSSPDKRRLEPQANEGRRIAKVKDGWLVLNGAKYREMAHEVAERARKAKWARENRARKPEATSNTESLIGIHQSHIKTLEEKRDAEADEMEAEKGSGEQ